MPRVVKIGYTSTPDGKIGERWRVLETDTGMLMLLPPLWRIIGKQEAISQINAEIIVLGGGLFVVLRIK